MEVSAATTPRAIVCWPCATGRERRRGRAAGRRGSGDRAVQGGRGRRTVEGRRDAERDERDRGHERDRNEDARRDASQIDVEVAEIPAAAEPANERDAAGEPGRGRGELRKDDREELAEVRERVLARVVLPVRVRDKARRRVEGEERVDRAHAVRVERQELLDLEDREQDHEHDRVRDEHRPRVRPPGLLDRRIDAAQAVDHAVDRVEHAVEERVLAGEDRRDVRPERPHQQQDDREDDRDLEPVEQLMSSELLRAEQRVEEVDERERDDDEQDVDPHLRDLDFRGLAERRAGGARRAGRASGDTRAA